MINSEEILDEINNLKEIVKQQNQRSNSDWMDMQEVCIFLKVSKRTVYNYNRLGRLKPHKILGKLYYKRSEIESALA